MTTAIKQQDVIGDVEFPQEWTVFIRPEDREDDDSSLNKHAAFDLMAEALQARLERAAAGDEGVLTDAVLRTVPEQLHIDGVAVPPLRLRPVNSQLDLRPLLGEPPFNKGVYQQSDDAACGRVAYIFIPLHSDHEQQVTLGMGVDLWLEAWLNGEQVCDLRNRSNEFPPRICNELTTVTLTRGANLLVIRFISGKGSSTLAVGGPRELRAGNYKSILADPLLSGDPQWTASELRVAGTTAAVVDIADRRELFVDDFLIDGFAGGASRRLHQPVAREIVLDSGMPWEGNCNGCFQPVSVFRDGDRILMYYKAANFEGAEDPSQFVYRLRDRSRPEATCLAVSSDGIHFERPNVGHHTYRGATDNNIVWQGRQYMTPFLDQRPGVPADERFKAITGHPDGGLAALVSGDGLEWRHLVDHPIITKGAFDSQNLAFWDDSRGCYLEFHRGREESGPRREIRGIMTCRSDDFIHWSEPEHIDYSDALAIHMYTNCIRPYERAPHLLIGTPARLITSRKKIPHHMDSGISDTLLICSRDGIYFKRWLEAFIRPGTDPESWTDRNIYTAWGMLQTSPEELSLYWCEQNGYPSLRMRRGTLRTDGFVSIHADAEPGEFLTRPFTFSGSRLTVNYCTSAGGTIMFELCHPDGTPIPGHSLADSEDLYGNEIAHTLHWNRSPDVSHLQGTPLRLRVRLQDADLYSFLAG